jgi:uncharacterized membrane protein YcaP (DUF421 family)
LSKIYSIEWADLVIPTHSILEMIVRGSLSYVALFLILRFLMKRQSSTIGIADILVIVVIADAAQNGFSKEYRSVTESIVLVLTIVFGTSRSTGSAFTSNRSKDCWLRCQSL